MQHTTPTSPQAQKSRLNSRKRDRFEVAPPPPDTSSDPGEVIPSSQSDEQELSILKRPRKDAEQIAENIRHWQMSSSQFDVHQDSVDPFAIMPDDSSMNFDYHDTASSLHYVQDEPWTPVSAEKVFEFPSSPSTARDSHMRPPAELVLSPWKTPKTSFPDPIRGPRGCSQVSPHVPSSTSVSTKVDTDVPVSPLMVATALKGNNIISPVKSRKTSPLMLTQRTAGHEVDAQIDEVLAPVDQHVTAEAIVERIKADARAKAMAVCDENSMTLDTLEDSDSELGSPITAFSNFVKEYVSCVSLHAHKY